MGSRRHLPGLCGGLALLLLATAAWPFTVDDAFIVARYADRIARGLGYTFSGAGPSDGVTGPLWLLPAWFARKVLHSSPPWALEFAKAASLLSAILALLLATRRVRGRVLGRQISWLVPLLVVSSLPYVIWSVAGLETGLAALCVTLLALAVTRAQPSGVIAGLASATLAWLRPELLAFACACLAWSWLRSVRAAGWGLAGLLAGVASVCALRWWLFGHLLPMTASAKPALLSNGVHYLVDSLAHARVLMLLPLIGCAFRAGTRDVRGWLSAVAVQAFAILLAGGDWMPGRRLFVPLLPVIALALALGLRALWLRRPRALAVYGSCLLLVSSVELAAELRAARDAGRARDERIPTLAALICAARGPVALVDLGALALACPDQEFIDLGGLTEPAVAYAAGAHLEKQIDARWLEQRAPGLVVLHSREAPRVDGNARLRWFAGYPVERRVLGMPFMRGARVQQIFTYAPRYSYVLLAPPQRAGSANITEPSENAP